jgi:hypothetical protein
MSIPKILSGVAFAVTVSALASPFLMAGPQGDGSRTGYSSAASPGDLQTPPGTTGWGKGSIVMPVNQQTGMFVGVLTVCDGPTKYVFEGELTGFMPSDGLTGGAEYWFGGMYGKMQAVASSEPEPGKDDIPWYEVEGMWVLGRNYEGSFSAQLLNRNEAGTQYVCGVVDGRFQVSDAMPGPAPAPGTEDLSYMPFADRLSRSKFGTAGGRVSDRASEGRTITCPKGDDPGFASIVPPKGGRTTGSTLGVLTHFGDAGHTHRTKDGGQYEGLPCTAGWHDTNSSPPDYGTPATPTWPVLVGSFDLRYQLYE